MIRPLALSLALAAATAGVAPVAAQDGADEKVNMVIVYGDDACPRSTGDEITVCARKDESERYRIPEALRFSDDPANVAWTERVQRLETVGKFGAMSCSPVGAGGFTGCTQQLIDAAYADKRNAPDVRFGQLIEEARAKRLSTIDASAAAEQARVEAIEKEYMDRLARESEAATPGESTTTPADTTERKPEETPPLAQPPQG
jgi:hypothetical protein